MTVAVLINMHTGNEQLGMHVIVNPPIPETAAQVNAAFGHNLHLFLTVACRLVVKRCVRAAPQPQATIFSYQLSHHSPTHREIHTSTNKQHILQPGLPNKVGLCPPVISDLFLLR